MCGLLIIIIIIIIVIVIIMDWLQFQNMEQEHDEMEALGQNLSMQQGLLLMGGDSIIENQIGMTPTPTPTATIDEVPPPSSSSGFKRRFSDEMIDKTIERKQKRMIKNRESAARSRARKQAYTNKLEQDVSMLKEANAALEKEMVLMRLPFDPNLRPKYQPRILPFRRANSATF
ncbi:hypothetical protein Scep_018629 [Stephania cephalantha]|uniref:BZIP domain-containing protein n=1 Tax=Stephania cephalantha TaxID=152367 RepID=A0AAP0I9F5_9MAGN